MMILILLIRDAQEEFLQLYNPLELNATYVLVRKLMVNGDMMNLHALAISTCPKNAMAMH